MLFTKTENSIAGCVDGNVFSHATGVKEGV